jgi:hypothetical protein
LNNLLNKKRAHFSQLLKYMQRILYKRVHP